MRKLDSNPAGHTISNFLAATNAYAEQLTKKGEKADFLNAQNASQTYQKMVKMSVALSDPTHPKHNVAFNALATELGKNSEAMDGMYAIGTKFIDTVRQLAASAVKNGIPVEKAAEFAFNSVAGNPVYDHFGNLNLLAGQLYEEQSFMQAFIDSGDAFSVQVENGGTGLATSRFRVPVEQVTGSAKIMNGDINPAGRLRDDNNRTQISLYNEFKNAVTLDTIFDITQGQRDQALGYERAVSPALAGFILQNRYFQAAQKQILKLAEIMFVGGTDANSNYIQNVGGSYGILSTAIQLQKSDWDAVTPSPATYADWTASANVNKLVQKIQNKYFLPTDVAAPLPSNLDPANMYKEIIRLFNLAAQANVNFMPRKWALFVPSSWYALAMQYPGSGTFNKQLQEMVQTAVGGKIIESIEVIPSSLLNYGASIGQSSNAYNYMVAMAMGAPQENKPVILPGQTALPTIISENVSAAIMSFRGQFLFGGPMFLHYGGAFILEFSADSTP